MENSLERVGVSVSEAEGVRRRYSSMVTALRGEAAAHRTTLDQLHMRLTQEREALTNLRVLLLYFIMFSLLYEL